MLQHNHPQQQQPAARQRHALPRRRTNRIKLSCNDWFFLLALAYTCLSTILSWYGHLRVCVVECVWWSVVYVCVLEHDPELVWSLESVCNGVCLGECGVCCVVYVIIRKCVCSGMCVVECRSVVYAVWCVCVFEHHSERVWSFESVFGGVWE
jgi:hypothetical protein